MAGDRVNSDVPPFSRVFIVCSRGHKEEDIQAAFQPFGQIEDVWMVKDRMTKENKGICYVKYDKASSAALAIENMDGKLVGNEPKPIKVCMCALFLCTCQCMCTFHSNHRLFYAEAVMVLSDSAWGDGIMNDWYLYKQHPIFFW